MRPLIVIRHIPNIDFMRWHKVGFALSLLMTLGSIVLFATQGLNYGIDFSGGTLIEARTVGGRLISASCAPSSTASGWARCRSRGSARRTRC